MACVLEALILETRVEEHPVVNLAFGWVLLPLTDSLKASLNKDNEPLLGFDRLTQAVIDLAISASLDGIAIYIHSEFHGGTGFQAAAAWSDGRLTCGPFFSANHASEALTESYEIVGETRRMAINRVLRWAGVSIGSAVDEFDAVGLGRYRWTEDWAEVAT